MQVIPAADTSQCLPEGAAQENSSNDPATEPGKVPVSGYFEHCTTRVLSGWAVENGQPATLFIYVNDEYLARVDCDQPRPDVSVANAGFIYQPPARSQLPLAARVSVRLSDGTELGYSPRQVPRHEGHIDDFTRSSISGWAAWDGRPAELSIQVDRIMVARILCDIARPDVTEAQGLPENLGFAYQFPRPLSETATVTVLFADGSIFGELNGLPAVPPDPLSSGAYHSALALHRAQIRPALNAVEAELHSVEDRPSAPNEPQRLRTMRDILTSGLFDAAFYLRDNPDIREAGVDPLDHYIRYGDAEGRRPNPFFWPAEYRTLNELPAEEGANALAHYGNGGERQGFKASLAFDPRAYLVANKPLDAFVGRPLFHFLKIGRDANLPVRSFDNADGRRRPRKQTPRIAAQLEVKDEVELIEQSIAHLRAIGVDDITVIDVGSTDGTVELLEKHRSDDFRIVRLSDRAASMEATPEDERVRKSYRSVPADWVLLLDADEFWIPASGNLKECDALDRLDVLSVRRFNVPLGPKGPMMPSELAPGRYEDLLLIAEPLPEMRKYLILDPETPSILGVEEPKIIVRPTKVGGAIKGNHDVINTGAPLRRATAGDLLIAHLPLSTKLRFEKKIANVSALFERDGVDLFSGPETWQNEAIAWHWRRWAALAREGKIAEEFQRNTFNEAQIADMRHRGTIRSAAELLAEGIVVPCRT